MTFDATLNPVVYEGGIPVFIDTERDSWNIKVIEELLNVGADVKYFDPWVSSFREGALEMTSEKELTKELVETADLVMITAAHSNVDYEFVQKHAQAIFDTKNVMKSISQRDNIEVL